MERKTFVEASVFESMYKDKYAELFGPQVQHALDEGEPEIAGRWTKGDFYSNLPGHHLYEDYKDTAVKIRRIHEDGSMAIEKDQAFKKFDALKDERKLEAKKAEDAFTAVGKSKGGAERIMAMMQQLQGLSWPDDEEPAKPEHREDDALGDDSDSESSSHDTSAPVSLFMRPSKTPMKVPKEKAAASTADRRVVSSSPMVTDLVAPPSQPRAASRLDAVGQPGAIDPPLSDSVL